MKKIVALILSLCLLCSAVALAETTLNQTTTSGTSTITYSVTTPDLTDSYTVVIPSSITIDSTTKTGTGTVTLKANPTLVSGTSIKVMLTSTENNFTLISKNGDKLAYKISMKNTDYTDNSYLHSASVLYWPATSVTEDKTQDITFTVTGDSVAVGDYSDKITFTISVE